MLACMEEGGKGEVLLETAKMVVLNKILLVKENILQNIARGMKNVF